MTVLSASRAPALVIGSDFNDPTNERLILLSAAGLVVVGLALLVGTILWWRRGRQEHPSLAPLEVMGTRSWWKAPDGDRNRRLQKVRTAGHSLAMDEPIRSEVVDLQALVRSVPDAFDDLREPGEVPAEVAAEAPVAFVVDGDGEVVAASEVQSSAEPVVPDAAEASSGDGDATSFSAERPMPAPAPAAPPANGVKVAGPEPDVKDQGPGALASSHGDQP